MVVRAVGISWFLEEDYSLALKIMLDAHVLPRTYDTWRKKAESQEREWKAKGFLVIRAIIDPEKFPTWCAKAGLNIDAKARTAFASEFAMLQVKDTN